MIVDDGGVPAEKRKLVVCIEETNSLVDDSDKPDDGKTIDTANDVIVDDTVQAAVVQQAPQGRSQRARTTKKSTENTEAAKGNLLSVEEVNANDTVKDVDEKMSVTPVVASRRGRRNKETKKMADKAESEVNTKTTANEIAVEDMVADTPATPNPRVRGRRLKETNKLVDSAIVVKTEDLQSTADVKSVKVADEVNEEKVADTVLTPVPRGRGRGRRLKETNKLVDSANVTKTANVSDEYKVADSVLTPVPRGRGRRVNETSQLVDSATVVKVENIASNVSEDTVVTPARGRGRRLKETAGKIFVDVDTPIPSARGRQIKKSNKSDGNAVIAKTDDPKSAADKVDIADNVVSDVKLSAAEVAVTVPRGRGRRVKVTETLVDNAGTAEDADSKSMAADKIPNTAPKSRGRQAKETKHSVKIAAMEKSEQLPDEDVKSIDTADAVFVDDNATETVVTPPLGRGRRLKVAQKKVSFGEMEKADNAKLDATVKSIDAADDAIVVDKAPAAPLGRGRRAKDTKKTVSNAEVAKSEDLKSYTDVKSVDTAAIVSDAVVTSAPRGRGRRGKDTKQTTDTDIAKAEALKSVADDKLIDTADDAVVPDAVVTSRPRGRGRPTKVTKSSNADNEKNEALTSVTDVKSVINTADDATVHDASDTPAPRGRGRRGKDTKQTIANADNAVDEALTPAADVKSVVTADNVIVYDAADTSAPRGRDRRAKPSTAKDDELTSVADMQSVDVIVHDVAATSAPRGRGRRAKESKPSTNDSDVAKADALKSVVDVHEKVETPAAKSGSRRAKDIKKTADPAKDLAAVKTVTADDVIADVKEPADIPVARGRSCRLNSVTNIAGTTKQTKTPIQIEEVKGRGGKSSVSVETPTVKPQRGRRKASVDVSSTSVADVTPAKRGRLSKNTRNLGEMSNQLENLQQVEPEIVDKQPQKRGRRKAIDTVVDLTTTVAAAVPPAKRSRRVK